ncbi:MAG: hypothetical protein WAW75_11540 [Gallionella sp.]
MKRIVIAAMMSVFVAAPAAAADGKTSVGVNYGLDWSGIFGIMGEYDISSMTNNQPVSVQVFWKKSTQTVLGANYEKTGFGAVGIYDFNTLSKLDKKIRPYAGVGVISKREQYQGWGTTTSSSLYFTGGIRYFLTPQFAADFNYNDYGGITVGANFSF